MRTKKSNIPKPVGKTKLPKHGPLSEVSPNIRRNSILSKGGRKSILHDPFFANKTTMAQMESRILPEELRSPNVNLNSKMDELFKYTNQISMSKFNSAIHQQFFSREISTLITQIYKSKNKVSQYPNVSSAFQTLNSLLNNNKEKLFTITDFCLLYCSIIIHMGNSDMMIAAKNFLVSFLDCDIPRRPDEMNILFQAIMTAKNTGISLQRTAAYILPKMTKYNSDYLERIKAHSENPDKYIAKACQETLKSLKSQMSVSGKRTTTTTLIKPEFAPIPSSIDCRGAISVLKRSNSAFSAGVRPKDYHQYIKDVVIVLERFGTSSELVNLGTSLLSSLLAESPIEIGLLGDIIVFCFQVLSPDAEMDENEILEAKSSANTLLETIFEKTQPENLLGAISRGVGISHNALGPMMERLEEYCQHTQVPPELLTEIADQIRGFREDFPVPAFLSDRLPAGDGDVEGFFGSISKLMDAESAFNEMERIVNLKDPELIARYPLYLRRFLQNAYYLYNKELPAGISEEDALIAEEAMRTMNSLTDADFEGDGEFSLSTLSTQLNELSVTK